MILSPKFQYISCYSLSSTITLSSVLQIRFNTSHVTLYRQDGRIKAWRISVSIHLMLLFIRTSYLLPHASCLFQYISCYSLSFLRSHWTHGRRVSIHLMLLFINLSAWANFERSLFQYLSCYSLSFFPSSKSCILNSFNTSHVTLYRFQSSFRKRWTSVSIHLMLLFIYLHWQNEFMRLKFQYISCYSLSLSLSHIWEKLLSFNTSHVTLYQLYLICKSLKYSSFNTSHVTLYQIAMSFKD